MCSIVPVVACGCPPIEMTHSHSWDYQTDNLVPKNLTTYANLVFTISYTRNVTNFDKMSGYEVVRIQEVLGLDPGRYGAEECPSPPESIANPTQNP